MKWLNCSKSSIVLVVFVAAIVLGGGPAKADFTFGTPTKVLSVNSQDYELHPDISADGLELYFCSNRSGGYGSYDIWITTRVTKDEPWGEPVNLGPTVNSAGSEWCPRVSADGLSLYFSSTRAGGFGGRDIWVTTRPTKNNPWGKPVNLGPTVNSSADDISACPASDGLSLFFHSTRTGGLGLQDLWVASRPTNNDPWGEPVNLGETVNSSADDCDLEISPDGLALFFCSSRPGGYGDSDLWVTTRKTTEDAWGNPVNLGPKVNTEADEWFPSISRDSSTLYFFSDRLASGGRTDIWQAPIIPIVDLDGDGIVDISDLLIMIDGWDTNKSPCDIGPTPIGDGVVDKADLQVLINYWGQEFDDPTLEAHWALDETDGNIAYDSAGENDGTLYGEPLWQPTEGQVNGALQFDGVDDYVSTLFVLNTSPGPFSVLAWVKGGIPGQVIFSQKGLSDWLLVDPADGSLTTKLRFLTKIDLTLKSEAVITDGNWHRVGLIWNGTNRILYVDDVEVASDTYEKGMLFGDLQIGAGKDLEAGSFWSGLIDDVRIYDRAVTP
jgi:Tol biopolymer transport system component